MSLVSEINRKSLHLLLVLIPLIFIKVGKWKTLAALAPITIVIVSLDYLRRKNPWIKNMFNRAFSQILREHELDGNKLCGASWVFLGACINFFLFKTEIAVTGFLIMVISDALSALVGKSFSSRPFFEKSLAGAGAFFLSALLILICCGMYFHLRFWFYFFGVFAVFCVTIIESRPSLFGIDDNFSIPISFSVVMTIFDLMWNYNY